MIILRQQTWIKDKLEIYKIWNVPGYGMNNVDWRDMLAIFKNSAILGGIPDWMSDFEKEQYIVGRDSFMSYAGSIVTIAACILLGRRQIGRVELRDDIDLEATLGEKQKRTLYSTVQMIMQDGRMANGDEQRLIDIATSLFTAFRVADPSLIGLLELLGQEMGDQYGIWVRLVNLVRHGLPGPQVAQGIQAQAPPMQPPQAPVPQRVQPPRLQRLRDFARVRAGPIAGIQMLDQVREEAAQAEIVHQEIVPMNDDFARVANNNRQAQLAIAHDPGQNMVNYRAAIDWGE